MQALLQSLILQHQKAMVKDFFQQYFLPNVTHYLLCQMTSLVLRKIMFLDDQTLQTVKFLVQFQNRVEIDLVLLSLNNEVEKV